MIIQADGAVSPAGIYCTLNPVNPALLGRAENRLKANAPRTADKEIAAVRHLLVDADPKRPAGISSTEEEKGAALALLRRIMAELRSLGWDEPLVADSGNGGHLIYRIEPDCGLLVPDLLKFLAHAYSDELVDIDTAVGNPARLTKVYGTMTRKGDSTGERPHCCASILHLPQRAVGRCCMSVNINQFLEFMKLHPLPEPANGQRRPMNGATCSQRSSKDVWLSRTTALIGGIFKVLSIVKICLDIFNYYQP